MKSGGTMKWTVNGIAYLREWMSTHGYNQAGLIKDYGISRSAISRMMRGEQDNIEEPTITVLCKAFKLTKRQLEDIIEGVPPDQVKQTACGISSALDPSLMPFFTWLSAQDDTTKQTFLGLWQTMQNLSQTSGNSPPAKECPLKHAG
ncbi:MAG: XRE family transcriptional regulator [Verrucomicrobiae bacterium]|nr:XRE family transcriptional regulator [Verrucomicrobiae bacterium]